LKVIPSVDLKDGKCVKLVQGKPGSGRVISEDPVEAALYWQREGAELLHIIDLDAAIYGSLRNRETIKRILGELSIPVEVGGGVRSLQDVEELLKAGASWVILGTAAFKNPNLVLEAAEKFGPEKLIVALDSAKGKILVEGWKTPLEVSPWKAAEAFENLGIHAFLYTDVEVEGTLEGVKLERVKQLAGRLKTRLIYAGGVASLGDLEKLKRAGVMGVVVGRALYDGRFTLNEAKKVAGDP